MCWVGYSSDKKIANKDIPCRKVIGYDIFSGVYKAWYMRNLKNSFYTIGETYTAELFINKTSCIPYKEKFNWTVNISTGLHCYSENRKPVYGDKKSLIVGNILFSGDNFVPILVDCIIPKGATYYENYFGEIVTNKLTLVKIHDFNNK